LADDRFGFQDAAPQLLAADDEDFRLLDRPCLGRADTFVYDRHLAEDLAASQRGQGDVGLLTEGADFDLPPLDDVGAVGGFPFEKDRRAGKVRLADQEWNSTAALRWPGIRRHLSGWLWVERHLRRIRINLMVV
jgi:hypothetical protein